MKKSLEFAALVIVVISACFFGGCVKALVYFNPDGGNIVEGDSTALYDGKIKVTAPDVSRDGYLFRGWNGEFGNPQEDITVNAMWDKLYTVTFDPVAGEETDTASAQTLTSSNTVVYPADPTREGYVFDGWDSYVVNVSEDTVITGKWKKLYTVKFNLNGGNTKQYEMCRQTIAEGGTVKAPNVSKDFMEPVVWDQELTNISSNITINAVWTRRVITEDETKRVLNSATTVRSFSKDGMLLAEGMACRIDSSTFVTCYHLIENAYTIKVYTYDVTEIVAFDKKLDLAILKTEGSTWYEYFDITARVTEAGELIYTESHTESHVENIYGIDTLSYDRLVTPGTVSGVTVKYNDNSCIQFSAPLLAFNAGGPLVDSRGYLVGIVISSTVNGNYAIPISRIYDLTECKLKIRDWYDRYFAVQ